MDKILDALVKVARPIILESFSVDSCIASTRIAVDVLRYFEITAEPLPLIVTVFNAETVRLAHEGKTLEEIGKIKNQSKVTDDGGPWSVGIGTGWSMKSTNGSEPWAGHLVAAIPGKHIIVDLSIDQAARPHKNMHLEPFWTQVEDEWWGGDKPVTELNNAGMSMILDRVAADPQGFLTSPNWKLSGLYRATFKDATGKIIRAIKKEIA